MAQKKKTKRPANENTFYFSVEGETERWYLEHLRTLVNDELKRQGAGFRIGISIQVQKDPRQIPWPFITRGEHVNVVHVCDYESPVPQQAGMNRLEQFKTILDNLSAAAEDKNLTYLLGYSNLSFELWMILHKQPCNGGKIDCKHYLADFNTAYGVSFLSTKACKKEDAFKDLLRGITLSDVHDAIERATAIQAVNTNQKAQAQRHRDYEFYTNNPALSIHERVQDIFTFCASRGYSV